MRLALLKTGSNGQSQILTPRLKNLEHRYMDRSSPLTPDYTPWRYLSDSNITVELTRRRESKHPSPHQASCETRPRRSRPTICSASSNPRTARRDNPPSI